MSRSPGHEGNPFAQYDIDTNYVPPEVEIRDDIVPAVPEVAVAAQAAASTAPQPTLIFTESTVNNTAIGGNISKPDTRSAEPTVSLLAGHPSSTGPPQSQGDSISYPFYNPRKYRSYFNVDTKDVIWRVRDSILGPLKADFLVETQHNPDLYGPFWVATTLVFVTAVAGNYAAYIAWERHRGHGVHKDSPPPSSGSGFDVQWYNDYNKMGYSAAIFYGYIFILGLGFYFVMAYFKSDLKLANIWCIYGYSLTIYVPISFLCILPFEALRWVVVLLATLSSGLFLVLNFKEAIYSVAPARASLIMLAAALCHIGLGLAMKLYFFQYKT